MSEIILSKLLLSFGGLPPEQIQSHTKELYVKFYCSETILTHDGGRITFTDERFDHAFFSTDDKINKRFGKHQFMLDRAERLHWIAAIVSGKVPGVECWKVPPAYAAAPKQRIY